MLWNHLKKYIEAEGLNILNTPKDIFRNAHKIGMMDTETLQIWCNYVDLHTGTTHDYNAEKTDKTLSKIEAFINDTKDLYKQMNQEEVLNKEIKL